jgi:hypothetical protein
MRITDVKATPVNIPLEVPFLSGRGNGTMPKQARP